MLKNFSKGVVKQKRLETTGKKITIEALIPLQINQQCGFLILKIKNYKISKIN